MMPDCVVLVLIKLCPGMQFPFIGFNFYSLSLGVENRRYIKTDGTYLSLLYYNTLAVILYYILLLCYQEYIISIV